MFELGYGFLVALLLEKRAAELVIRLEVIRVMPNRVARCRFRRLELIPPAARRSELAPSERVVRVQTYGPLVFIDGASIIPSAEKDLPQDDVRFRELRVESEGLESKLFRPLQTFRAAVVSEIAI